VFRWRTPERYVGWVFASVVAWQTGGPSPVGAIQAEGNDDIDWRGSGFIITATGEIVTNEHVVRGCGTIQVKRLGQASLLAADPKHDLALIRLDKPSKDTAVVRLDPRAARTGDQVIAIGYSAADDGIRLRTSTGRALGTARLQGNQFLTFAGEVAPGNSGGPLLSRRGRVLGVIKGTFESSSVPFGTINFAIETRVLSSFLRAQQKGPLTLGEKQVLSPQAIESQAGDFVVPILCSPHRDGEVRLRDVQRVHPDPRGSS
jgi:S1-C subfamily serine protease